MEPTIEIYKIYGLGGRLRAGHIRVEQMARARPREGVPGAQPLITLSAVV